MTVQVNTGPNVGSMTMQSFPSGFRGGKPPFDEVCRLYHNGISDKVSSSGMEISVKLDALEQRMVTLGMPVPNALAMWKLRCAYMRDIVGKISGPEKCPHECESISREVGTCWQCT